MYNRYIRNDQGTYTRIPGNEPSGTAPPPREHPPSGASAPNPDPSNPTDRHAKTGESEKRDGGFRPDPGNSAPQRDSRDIISQALRRLLDRFHLETVDTGDLLLLLLLFLLYEEKADEELLFALSLLLIL